MIHLYSFLDFWLRAGGAGGGSSGGGSYGGGHYGGGYSGSGSSGDDGFIIYLLLRLIGGGPIGWIILAVIAVVFYKFFVQGSTRAVDLESYEAVGRYSPYESQAPAVDLGVLDGQSLEDFQNKVAFAFTTVQQAWSQKRVDLMRRFISDGVYQRFHAQFTMMNLLDQSNPISNLHIHDIRIVKTQIEGGYQCVDVEIAATSVDQFVSRKYPQLNSIGGAESYAEFWSFIRRIDYQKGKDIFQSESCPKCSAPLTMKLVETAKCPYCGTYINNGEYDWVLSEITQQNDYNRKIDELLNLPTLKGDSLQSVLAVYPSFSTHVLEDRASNAFMQILIGAATGDLNAVKKFTSDIYFKTLSTSLGQHRFVYDRLFTKAVDVLSVQLRQGTLIAFVAIAYEFQQVDLNTIEQTISVPEDHSIDYKVLMMVRTLSDVTAKGSTYAGTCPSCGAPVKDSLDVTCRYCGHVFNDSKLDWIVDSILSLKDYRELCGQTVR